MGCQKMRITEDRLRGIIRELLESSRERRAAQRAVTGRPDTLRRTAEIAYDLVARNGAAPPRFAFTMTDIEKVGINPMSGYKTPAAVFAYPATLEMVDDLLGGTYRNIGVDTRQKILASDEEAGSSEALQFDFSRSYLQTGLPFRSGAPYINFFELTDLTDVFYTSRGMSSDRYRRATDALLAWFRENVQDSDHLDTFKKLLVKAQQHNNVPTPSKTVHAPSSSMDDEQRLATVWTLSRALSHVKVARDFRLTPGGKYKAGTSSSSSLWGRLLLIAGVKAVVDDAGSRLIYENEPTQLAVMDTSIIKVLDRIGNKTPALVGRDLPDIKSAVGKKKIDRDIENGERVAGMVNEITNDVLGHRGYLHSILSAVGILNTDASLAVARKNIDIDKLMDAVRLSSKSKGLTTSKNPSLMGTGLDYCAAYILSGREEAIDILVSLIDSYSSKSYLHTVDFMWDEAPNAKRSFARLFLKKLVRRFSAQAENETDEAWVFLSGLAASERINDKRSGAFNFGLFIETVRPMLDAISRGSARKTTQVLVDELAKIWVSKAQRDAQEEIELQLKRRAELKGGVTATLKARDLMAKDPYTEIKDEFDTVWTYKDEALRRATQNADKKSFEELIKPFDLIGRLSEIIQTVDLYSDYIGRTGRELIDIVREYESECRDILQDFFDDSDLTLKSGERLSDEERKHDQRRIVQARKVLDRFKKDFMGVMDGMGNESQRARARIPVSETRGNR
jgi:hypothetical protein